MDKSHQPMACISSIQTTLSTTSSILEHFATHTQQWLLLSMNLLDIKEGLDAASLSFQSWNRKYDIHEQRADLYMYVLFGSRGWQQIARTVGKIEEVSKGVRDGVGKVVACALRTKRGTTCSSSTCYDKLRVQTSIHDLLSNPAWSQKFVESALAMTSRLEVQLLRLFRKLGMLERFSDQYLESEHPSLLSVIGPRLTGRRTVAREGEERRDMQHKILDAASARKDAELLYRALVVSSSSILDHKSKHENEEVELVHISLHVQQIHQRDFAFLLSLRHGQAQEILAHPVKIKAANDSNLVQCSMSSALRSLMRNDKKWREDGGATYLLPSSSSTSSAGFQVFLPPSTLLSGLELKDSLATIIGSQNYRALSQQILYPQDQVALACGITSGCLRLIGTPWLDSLDDTNIRWRRGADGRWKCMMAAAPGNASTGRALDNRREKTAARDSQKRVQIFRIGLLVAEIALKIPVTYLSVSSSPSTSVQIYLDGIGEGERVPIEVAEITAEVENRTNVLVVNMVFACLNVLQEDIAGDVDKRFYRDVLGQVEELEGLITRDRNASVIVGSATGTPRNGRSERSRRSSMAYGRVAGSEV